jgi:hypothetical protein
VFVDYNGGADCTRASPPSRRPSTSSCRTPKTRLGSHEQARDPPKRSPSELVRLRSRLRTPPGVAAQVLKHDNGAPLACSSANGISQPVKQEAGPAPKSVRLKLLASRASRVGGLRAQAGT